MQKNHYAACAVALSSSGNVVQLLPAGEFRASDGRPDNVPAWKLDNESAAALIAASTGAGRLSIDYEHQSLNTVQNGQPAPAAGWFSALEWREGLGLFATDVQWTDKARQMIQSGEYLYISPVIEYGPEGVVTRIISAGLTNHPALSGMEEVTALSLVQGQTGKEGDPLPRDVAALVRQSHELLAALKAKSAEVEKSNSELAALRSQIETEKVEAVIERALDGAALLPWQVEEARKLGRMDLAALTVLLDRPPLIPALLGPQTDALRAKGWQPPGKEAGLGMLTPEERHVASLAGRTPQEFAAMKARFINEESGNAD